MKKILAIVLAVAMIASVAMLAGCGQSKQNDAAATADSAKETLTMATNAYFPPYEYYEGDKIIGIDAEVAQAIADKLGMELKIVDIEFDSIITAVLFGGITSSGSTIIVQLLNKAGLGLTASVFVVQIMTDYLDRILSLVLVAFLLRMIPRELYSEQDG